MCGGGDDSDSGSDDNVDVGYDAGQVDPGLAAFAGYSTGGAGATADVSQANTTPNVANYDDSDNYVDAVLTSQGYSSTNKGVTDGKGNAVTDGFGNPVMSGSYVNAQNEAESEFQAYQEYQEALAEAQEDFYDDMEARQMVDQDLIDVAMGQGGYIAGDITDPNFDPTAVDVMMGPPSMQNLQSYGNFLGSAADQFSFPEFSFNDPFGTAMAPTLNAIDGDPNTLSFNERNYFTNFQEGYNNDAGFLGSQIESDAANNVGFSSAGQRFSDAAGGVLMGIVGGALAGPLGSALAAGTNVNTMSAYGPQVPGFTPQVNTVSFDPGAALGNALGSQLGSVAGQKVAGNVYGNTGNVNAAIGAGAAATAGGGMLGTMAGEGIAGGMGINPMVSSSIGDPIDGRVAEIMNSTFGQQVGDDDGGSVAPTAEASEAISQLAAEQAAPVAMSQQVVQTAGAEDVAAGDTPGIDSEGEFDADEFLRNQALLSNPNAQQVTDFFGNAGVDLSINPLFSAAPAGVQYLSKGRQRQYGNAIYSVANKLRNQAGARRAGFGNRLTGLLV